MDTLVCVRWKHNFLLEIKCSTHNFSCLRTCVQVHGTYWYTKITFYYENWVCSICCFSFPFLFVSLGLLMQEYCIKLTSFFFVHLYLHFFWLHFQVYLCSIFLLVCFYRWAILDWSWSCPTPRWVLDIVWPTNSLEETS